MWPQVDHRGQDCMLGSLPGRACGSFCWGQLLVARRATELSIAATAEGPLLHHGLATSRQAATARSAVAFFWNLRRRTECRNLLMPCKVQLVQSNLYSCSALLRCLQVDTTYATIPEAICALGSTNVKRLLVRLHRTVRITRRFLSGPCAAYCHCIQQHYEQPGHGCRPERQKRRECVAPWTAELAFTQLADFSRKFWTVDWTSQRRVSCGSTLCSTVT